MDRWKAAEKAWGEFELIGFEVRDAGGWWDRGEDEWSRSIYLENGDEPSTRETFVVRFIAGTDQVEEAYISGWN